MATIKPRFSVTFSDDSFEKIKEYQKTHNISTQSKAVASLVEIAINEIEPDKGGAFMGSNVSTILKEKRKGLGLSVKTVLDELRSYDIEISDKTLYGWESGHRQPDADTFLALCQIYGIDTLKGTTKAPSISDEADSDADPLRSTLLHNFDQLNQEGREKLVDTSDDMVSSGKYIKSDPAELGKEKEA